MIAPVIVWFRQDLRLDDNPALAAAASTRQPVLPVYIHDEETPGRWAPGGASRWWLHHSLSALGRSLASRGVSLVLRRGRADTVLSEIIRDSGASAVYWNRCYEPATTERDTQIKQTLKSCDVEARSFNASLLHEPWEIKTGGGTAYKVFTPFWRACREAGIDTPFPPPLHDMNAAKDIGSDDLDTWALCPSRPNWAKEFPNSWTPGEGGAKERLARFIDAALQSYSTGRDRPDRDLTSGLSPHLHFGEIGPRQVVRALRAAASRDSGIDSHVEKFLSEIGWREFSHHLLHHMADLPRRSVRPEFEGFPWRDAPGDLAAWQRGQTGIPIVDAGMRQLWQTGWMHNRVRMIVASFLVKHLLIDWRMGAAWFWDTLVDADLANNSASWQWVAGCGADAAPYFRIFNPVLQGEKFDPQGHYVRRFVPELTKMPDKWLHKPWLASPENAQAVGLGSIYPRPIVDLAGGRSRALAAFAAIKASS